MLEKKRHAVSDNVAEDLKSNSPTPQSRPNSSLTARKTAFISEEKAKAFEIFRSGYPAGAWIDGQKALLKNKYSQAKSMGENANKHRAGISYLRSFS